VLALNALHGLGTALAPVLVAIVVALGAWWLLPVVVACIAVLLFGVAYAQPLRLHVGNADADRPTSLNWIDLPRRFWLYAAAVFVYGIMETLNGNWAMLYLSSERSVSAQGASFALAFG
jgi:fucose permease